MKKYTNYKKLSKVGNKGELIFYEWLTKRGFTKKQHIDTVYEKEGLSRSDWDVRATDVDGVTATFEVKHEPKAKYYVNVEQVQSGKLAGLSTTKADYFVFIHPIHGIGFCRTEVLNQIADEIKAAGPKRIDYTNGNTIAGRKLWSTESKYTNSAQGYLVKIDDKETIEWVSLEDTDESIINKD